MNAQARAILVNCRGNSVAPPSPAPPHPLTSAKHCVASRFILFWNFCPFAVVRLGFLYSCVGDFSPQHPLVSVDMACLFRCASDCGNVGRKHCHHCAAGEVTGTEGGCDFAIPPNCTGNNTSTVNINVWTIATVKSAVPGRVAGRDHCVRADGR
jgi:hypothetical protein